MLLHLLDELNNYMVPCSYVKANSAAGLVDRVVDYYSAPVFHFVNSYFHCCFCIIEEEANNFSAVRR